MLLVVREDEPNEGGLRGSCYWVRRPEAKEFIVVKESRNHWNPVRLGRACVPMELCDAREHLAKMNILERCFTDLVMQDGAIIIL